jgi:tripartite-type tricarboxylate transporter receptor subunit TctC
MLLEDAMIIDLLYAEPATCRKSFVRLQASFSLAAAALALALAAGPAAHAQGYPSKPIRLVVPYGPGGAGDVIARIVSQRLGADLSTTVIVDNRPGASGMIGAAAVANAPADGYTVLLGNTTEMVVAPYIVKSASYETQRSFQPVALAGYLPQVLVAHPSVGARTIDEFIAVAKAHPNRFSYATAGSGSAAQIGGALLEKLAGIKLLKVPYKGGAQAVNDVLAGNVSIYFSGIPPSIGNIKSGRLVALGTASTKPVASLPGVVPLASGALSRLDLSAWFGFFVPKNTPPEIVKTLNARIGQILETPEVQARLVGLGVEPEAMSPDQFENFVIAERKKYMGLVTELAIESD